MRNSWNFSTAILEIWVLVLTKPGWANETPTTSLKDAEGYNGHSHHHHHHHLQPSHHNHHYSVAGSISRDLYGNRNSHHLHSPSSFYSNSGSYNSNNNRHYSHHHHHSDFQSTSALASSSSSLSSSTSYSLHRCYVCLPPNKNSREAQQILDIFAKELRPLIPDCSAFDPYVDAGRFEFDCPPRYGGCILRIHGTNVSRACSKYRVNDCKKANSVEFCYCTTPLCNDKKPEPAIIPAVVHMSRNAGGESNPMRRGNGDSTSNRSKSPLRSRAGGDEVVGNSQGIRVRVDDEELLSPPDRENVVDDDEDNSDGSGTGSPDQHNTFIDPYTSTLDPTIFHEDSIAVDMEDPNPHTKIGISMTASTSSSSSAGGSIMGRRSWWWSSSRRIAATSIVSQGLLSRVAGSCSSSSTNILHLFLHLHRVLFVRLFAEQVVDEEGELHHHQQQLQLSSLNSDSITGSSIDVTHYLFGSQPRRHDHHHPDDDIRDELGGMIVVDGEPPGEATTTFPLLPLFFNSQLCFIISFLVVLKVLSS